MTDNVIEYLYELKNTKTHYTVGIFDSLEKAEEVLYNLTTKMNYIILAVEINKVYKDAL